MTGDEIDKDTMIFADKSDLEVALMVRMLTRNQLNHEAVCCGARDRIMFLSQEVERLCDEVKTSCGLKCPNCIDDEGFTVKAVQAQSPIYSEMTFELEQVQCEFCYTVEDSIFNRRKTS